MNHGNAGIYALSRTATKYGFNTIGSKHGVFDPDKHMNILHNNIDSEIERRSKWKDQKQKEQEQYQRRLSKVKPQVKPSEEPQYNVPQLSARQKKQGMLEQIKNILENKH